MTPETIDAITNLLLKAGSGGAALFGAIYLGGKYLDLKIAKARGEK